MYLKKVKLCNFRNYSKLTVSFNKGINIIYGNNAQGKTNLLESIYTLAFTDTFRSISIQDLIKKGFNYFNIEGVLKKDKLDTNIKFTYINNKKNMIIDSNNITKVSDYISNLNVILFTPEDLAIIKGPPINRRNFLNSEISQLYRNYYILYNEYEKILKLRNDYIKNNVFNKDYFDILTNYLIDKNILIYKLRKKFIKKLNLYCNKIFWDITGLNNFKIVYNPNVDYEEHNFDKEYYLKFFQAKYIYEFKNGSTYYGVHKDDFDFFLDDNDLKYFGSQGQQKLAVLTLKLSEIEIFKMYKNELPILLLDDIFSEIDNKKNSNLLKYLNNGIQVIITNVSLQEIDDSILKKAKVFNINNGKLKIQRGDIK